MCSFPSLLSFIGLYFLPESPKFLISKERFEEAKAVFKRIYECNTGNMLSPHAVSIFFILVLFSLNAIQCRNLEIKIADFHKYDFFFLLASIRVISSVIF